jgi:hypothetical protein
MPTVTNGRGHPAARGFPPPQRAERQESARASLWGARAAMCALVSFLGASACVLGPCQFCHLEVDPAKYDTIELRDSVEIKLTVIRTDTTAAPRPRVYVLAYVEQENRKGFMPDTESEYANLFLVRPEDRRGDAGAVQRSRYLVVDLWHYYPTQGIKTCHQWTIWEDDPPAAPTRATLHFLVEDSNNLVLDARDVPLEPRTLEHLGAFYLRIKGVFAQRVHAVPIKLTGGTGRPDPAFGAQESPWSLVRPK